MEKLKFISIFGATFFFFLSTATSQNYSSDSQQIRENFNAGKYAEAAVIFEKWLPALNEDRDEYDSAYLNLCELVGRCYQNSNQFEKALDIFEKLTKTDKAFYGEAHPKYASDLFQMAECQYALENYEVALPLYEEARNIQKKVNGSKDLDYAMTINKLGLLNSDIGNLDTALKFYEEFKGIILDVLGPKHYNYAMSLNNMALLYDRMGNYEAALPLFNEAILLFEETTSNKSEDYASSLNNLAILYYHMGKYEAALPLYEKAKTIRQEVLGTKHPQYAVSVNNLATLYESMGNYWSALPLYEESSKIIIDVLGKKNKYYAMSLNNLAGIYSAMGNYELALPLHEAAIKVFKEVLGVKNPEYTTSLSGLALINEKLGNYEVAATLFNEVLSIEKEVLGDQHPSYAMTLNNLANVYLETGKYQAALPLYEQARRIRLEGLGAKHPDYATTLESIAMLYSKMGKYDLALPLNEETIKIRLEMTGNKHPYYATSLSNLARLYFAMGNYEAALPLYEEARNIRLEVLGNKNPEYAMSLSSLAVLKIAMGNPEAAIPLYEEASIIINQNIQEKFSYLSRFEKEKYLFSLKNFFYMYLSFQKKIYSSYPDIAGYGFNNELLLKGLVLSSINTIQQSIIECGDTSLTNRYEQMLMLKQQITSQKQKRISKRRTDLASIEKKANDLERELAQRSQIFAEMQSSFRIKWEDVQKQLGDNEAAIEFVSFPYFNNKFTDSTFYCAFVIRKFDTLPRMSFLCEESQLKKVIPHFNALFPEINSSYHGQDLYNLIWQPLENLLSGITTVYYAPSGMLNSVSLAAIPCPGNKVLLDRYKLVQLSSTRSLALPKEALTLKDAVVYGGIKYDSDTNTLISTAKKYHENEIGLLAYNRSASNANRNGFRFLPGTQKEAEIISSKFQKKGILTTTYSGTDALEESFIALSGNNSPSVIHLSTHGFYYPDSLSGLKKKDMMLAYTGDLIFRYSNDPLLRSGLLMAGANLAWKGLPIPEGLEDGILTAKEVSNMNLMNTNLVVLSACQTGLGDVKGSEGVEGLQRGFKMAGARYLIMSLWEVPDKETTEFMGSFYDHWLGGQEIHEAFRTTQAMMSKKYKNEPFKWAAFVLVE